MAITFLTAMKGYAGPFPYSGFFARNTTFSAVCCLGHSAGNVEDIYKIPDQLLQPEHCNQGAKAIAEDDATHAEGNYWAYARMHQRIYSPIVSRAMALQYS